MGIEQALRSAAAMGNRAGLRMRRQAVPGVNPFPAGDGSLATIRRAWDIAYAAAAWRIGGGADWPASDPAGQGRGSTSWDALMAAGPDAAGHTSAVTVAVEDEWLAAAAGDPYTSAAIMLYPAAEDAARLAQDGGDPPEQLHVTLGMLAQPADSYDPGQRQQLVEALTGTWGAEFTAEPFAVAHFNQNDPEREPCVTVLVQSAELAEAQDVVKEAVGQAGLDLDDTFPIWFPHVTLGYGLDPATVTPEATSAPVRFDRLVIGWGEEQVQVYPAAQQPTTTEGSMTDTVTAAAGDTPADTTAAPPAPATPAAEAATGDEPTERGWSGPLALLGVPSSDKRILTPNGRLRTMPQPLNFQERNEGGHYGSTVVGAARDVQFQNGQLWGRGTYLGGWNDDVERARQQVEDGLGLVSVDTVPGVVSFQDADGNPIDPATYTGDVDDVYVVFDEWEFGGVTIVSFPAFDGVRITNDPPEPGEGGDIMAPIVMPGEVVGFAADNPAGGVISEDGQSIALPDGTSVAVGDTVNVPDGEGDLDSGTITAINVAEQTVTVQLEPDADADDQAQPEIVTVPVADLSPAPAIIEPGIAASASLDEELETLIASIGTAAYTAAFFQQRELLGPTPLTVDRQTREVYGHLATWETCHLERLATLGICMTPPVPPDSEFPYFHLGEVETDAGPMAVGKITVGGGHAHPKAGVRGAMAHYDNSCSQTAVIRCYADDYGIQFTGQLVHGVDPAKVDEMMRAGQLSGDWRRVVQRGDMELIAALAVNVPGFPTKRPATKYGMVGDRQMSLVAAAMVAPEEHPTVRLPSGVEIPRNDWDALVAAASEAIDRNQPDLAAARKAAAAVKAPADQLALQRARTRQRLALAVAGRAAG